MTDQEIFLRNAMETHGDAVYRLALCRLQNTADAEDVYQDVFLRLLGQPAESWDGEHLKAWLLRTALNRCADLHRFRLRCPALSPGGDPGHGPARRRDGGRSRRRNYGRPVAPAAGKAADGGASALRRGLPNRGDRRHAGASRAATVRTRLRRARMKLKDLLGGIDDEEPVSDYDGSYPHPRRAE